MPRLMRSFSASMSSTLALTVWPFSYLVIASSPASSHDRSDMCTMPSMSAEMPMNRPNSVMLRTSPSTVLPTGCSSWNCSHGLRCTCLRPSEMRRLELSTSSTSTSTSWLVATILPGWTFFLVQLISRHVDQAFDARLQLHEGAVVGDVGHAARILGARRILRGHTLPRIGLELLHAQADALRLAVEADDLHAHGLADLQRLARVVDAAPGDVGDMQQPVHAAQVHEGAVVGDVLDHAVEDHAFLEALDQLAPLLGARLLQHGPAGDDDVAAGAVHLQDLERLRRAHQRTDVAHRADVHLAAGQERHGAAQVDGEAALDPAVDRAVHALLRLERLLQVGPGLLAAGLLARQDDGAVAVLVPLDIQLDVVAGLDLGLLAGGAEFLEGDAALALEADVDDGVFVGQADDAAGDDGALEAAPRPSVSSRREAKSSMPCGGTVDRSGRGCHVVGKVPERVPDSRQLRCACPVRTRLASMEAG